jgi:hypothetical protein
VKKVKRKSGGDRNEMRSSASSQNKGRRLVLSPEELTEMAFARFDDLKQFGRLTPMKDLEKRFQRDRSVISKAVARAFRDRLVEVMRIRKPARPMYEDDARRKLLKRYKGLQEAVVVKNPPQANETAVHRNLGMAMAEILATNAIVQRDEVLGIGPGHSVEMTIESLQYFEQLRASSVTLMSLTGAVYSTPRAEVKGLWLDADRHVIEFAKSFPKNRSSTLSPIQLPMQIVPT